MSELEPSLRWVPLLAGLVAGLFWLGLGPFSHLVLADRLWPRLQRQLSPPRPREARAALWAGALMVDVGFYPGAPSQLSHLVHHVRPWDLCQSLLEDAADATECAFAWGWLSHALGDLECHGRFINPAVAGAGGAEMLEHKKLEWGTDCWFLGEPEQKWLWNVQPAYACGYEPWQRAMCRVYGRTPSREVLEQAVKAQHRFLRLLPRLFWLSGQLRRPSRRWGNLTGHFLGLSLRPLAVSLLDHSPKSLDVQAVLAVRPPTPRERLTVELLLAGLERRLPQMEEHGTAWPELNLDARDDGQNEDLPQARAALAWLAES
ncbi:MAG: zinc dependent phospholipase C family protein [Deltaproteobacteria bacterium]|nr:zinc dependent phospholipase C family protein [Deltaproteobacteria bacterium]